MAIRNLCQGAAHVNVNVLRGRRVPGRRGGLLVGVGRCCALGAGLLITPDQHHTQEVLVRELLGLLLEPLVLPLSIT